MWKTETGLKDNYVVTITDARFATSPKYKDGTRLMLVWDCEDEGGAIFQESFPCPDGWFASQSGRVASHPAGSDKLFNKNSFIGKLIDRCIKDLNLGPVFEKQGFEDPRSADGWVGFKFRMERQDLVFGKNKDTGEMITSNRSMPVEFMGVVKKTSEADLMGTLASIAEREDAQTFETEALKIPEVKQNNTLVVRILSGDLYKEFRS